MIKKIAIIVIIFLLIVIFISRINSNDIYNAPREESNNSDEIENTIDIGEILKECKIANYLPNDISTIKTINYITEDKKTNIYTDKESIIDFISILSNSLWKETSKDEKYCYFAVEIGNPDEITKIELGPKGNARIIKDSLKINFDIGADTYIDIFGFGTEKYYLHKSQLEIPKSEQCYKFKNRILKNLTNEEIKNVQETIYSNQQYLEIILAEKIYLLKESSSIYWEQQAYDKTFTDPITGIEVYEKNNLINIANNVEKIIELLDEEYAKEELQNFCNTLYEGIEEKNIKKCFEAHKILHDYCYWVINYPVESLNIEPYDWNASETYFGTIKEY